MFTIQNALPAQSAFQPLGMLVRAWFMLVDLHADPRMLRTALIPILVSAISPTKRCMQNPHLPSLYQKTQILDTRAWLVLRFERP